MRRGAPGVHVRAATGGKESTAIAAAIGCADAGPGPDAACELVALRGHTRSDGGNPCGCAQRAAGGKLVASRTAVAPAGATAFDAIRRRRRLARGDGRGRG